MTFKLCHPFHPFGEIAAGELHDPGETGCFVSGTDFLNIPAADSSAGIGGSSRTLF